MAIKNYKLETITYHDKSICHRETLSIQLNTIDKLENDPARHAKNQSIKAASDKLGLLYINVYAPRKHQKSVRDFSWLCKLDEAKGLKPDNKYRNDKSAQLYGKKIAHVKNKNTKKQQQQFNIFIVKRKW